MQDEPAPAEILAAVARWLKEEIAPATTGHLSFQARVAANALEMARRQIDLAPEGHAAEHAQLETLLGMTGDLLSLNHELCRRIRAGEASLATPSVAEHLRRVTLEKLAVDQPTYASYRAELAAGKPVAAI